MIKKMFKIKIYDDQRKIGSLIEKDNKKLKKSFLNFFEEKFE